jgi:hypothetical protein
MRLASVQTIREQLGFDDMTDINSAIEMALNSVEPQLAAQLGTRFERATVVDTFWVSQPGFRQGRHVETEFRLSRGMLAGAPLITYGFSASGSDHTTLEGLRVNLEKGTVHDFLTRYDGSYVRVSYSAGFEPEMSSGDNPAPTGQYVLDQVPGWLQEAAKLKALIHLAGAEPIQEAGITIDTKVLGEQLTSIINANLRYTPSALLPI